MMVVHGTPVTYPPIQLNESPIIVNTIKGYLAYCQNQKPELDIEYFITGNESSQVSPQDKFNSLAQIWKQFTQSERLYWDNDAAKNEPNPGEPGEGGHGSHPRLTPYETEGVLKALTTCSLDWNIEEDSDDDDE